MDRSFLSQPRVIAAARQFVAVRLATYENAAEGRLLQALAPTGSGRLENTVFTILSPDGTRELARGTRSARETFGNADRMADTMNRIARWYPTRPTAEATPDLPTVANVRLAVNMAACDHQPLVILYDADARARRALRDRLRPLAWGEAVRGRFLYVEAASTRDLAMVAGARAPGMLIVQPDRFGQKGTVLVSVPPDADARALAQGLRDGAARHQPDTESFRQHVRDGHEEGVFWETIIPVTDPMERQARERGRRSGP